jgi:hypothetical protein
MTLLEKGRLLYRDGLRLASRILIITLTFLHITFCVKSKLFGDPDPCPFTVFIGFSGSETSPFFAEEVYGLPIVAVSEDKTRLICLVELVDEEVIFEVLHGYSRPLGLTSGAVPVMDVGYV